MQARQATLPALLHPRTVMAEEDGFANPRGVILIGALLALLQAADGILTSMGVTRFGVGIEGNPLLRSLMETFGHIPTLTLVKACAIVIVVILTIIAHRLQWVRGAMGALCCIYILAAIIPWTYILFIRPILIPAA